MNEDEIHGSLRYVGSRFKQSRASRLQSRDRIRSYGRCTVLFCCERPACFMFRSQGRRLVFDKLKYHSVTLGAPYNPTERRQDAYPSHYFFDGSSPFGAFSLVSFSDQESSSRRVKIPKTRFKGASSFLLHKDKANSILA
jgi:hypothetical protein